MDPADLQGFRDGQRKVGMERHTASSAQAFLVMGHWGPLACPFPPTYVGASPLAASGVGANTNLHHDWPSTAPALRNLVTKMKTEAGSAWGNLPSLGMPPCEKAADFTAQENRKFLSTESFLLLLLFSHQRSSFSLWDLLGIASGGGFL